MVKLGSKVKDSLTLFAGTVIGRAEYLYETPSLLIAQDTLNNDGSPVSDWFSESRFVIREEPASEKLPAADTKAKSAAAETKPVKEAKPPKDAAPARSLADSKQDDAYKDHKPAGAAEPAKTERAKTEAETPPSDVVPYAAVKQSVLALAQKDRAALIQTLKDHNVASAVELQDRPALLANFHGAIERALIAAANRAASAGK